MENEEDAFSMLGHSLPNGSPIKAPQNWGLLEKEKILQKDDDKLVD